MIPTSINSNYLLTKSGHKYQTLWRFKLERSDMSPFGFNCFQAEDPQRRASKELDKQLAGWKKEYDKSIKLLLLGELNHLLDLLIVKTGAGESGKTTIIKQMKILHVQGFTPEERMEKVIEIRRNVFESILDVTFHMDTLEPSVSFEQETNSDILNHLRQFDITQETREFPQEAYEMAMKLWSDAGVQESYRRSNEYQLIDCAK